MNEKYVFQWPVIRARFTNNRFAPPTDLLRRRKTKREVKINSRERVQDKEITRAPGAALIITAYNYI